MNRAIAESMVRFIRLVLEVKEELLGASAVGRAGFDSNELRVRCRVLTGDVE